MKNSETKDIQSHSRNTVLGEVSSEYKEYVKWIEDNYESTNRELTVFIEENGLLMRRKYNLTGEEFRLLTKEEFELINEKSFIEIPKFKKK